MLFPTVTFPTVPLVVVPGVFQLIFTSNKHLYLILYRTFLSDRRKTFRLWLAFWSRLFLNRSYCRPFYTYTFGNTKILLNARKQIFRIRTRCCVLSYAFDRIRYFFFYYQYGTHGIISNSHATDLSVERFRFYYM